MYLLVMKLFGRGNNVCIVALSFINKSGYFTHNAFHSARTILHSRMLKIFIRCQWMGINEIHGSHQ